MSTPAGNWFEQNAPQPAAAPQPPASGDWFRQNAPPPAQTAQPATQPAPQPATQPTPQPGMLSRAADYLAHGGGGSDPQADALADVVTGFGKEGLRSVAGVAQLAHDGLERVHPGWGEAGASQHSIDAARKAADETNATQKLGGGVEDLWEWMGGQRLLEKGVESIPQLTKAMAAMKRYEEASPAVKRVIVKAARVATTAAGTQGAIGGAEGAAKTGSIEGAKSEAKLGAALGVAGEAAGSAGNRVLDYGKGVLDALKPDTTDIAGVQWDRLASQRPVPHTMPDPPVSPDATPGNTPKYAKSNQVSARQTESNLARRAGERSVERTNQIRAAVDPSKVRPAPDLGSEFHIPSEPDPGANGAATAGRAVRPNATVVDPKPELTAGWKLLGDGSPEAGEGAAGELGDGSASLARLTRDPAEAQQALSMLEERAEDGPLSPQLEDGRQRLADQVRMHFAQLSGPSTLYRLDPADAMRGVRTYREAADRLANIHQPTWSALDQASDGRFSQLRRAEKQALRTMRTSPDEGVVARASQSLDQVRAQMDQVFDQNPGVVSRSEWVGAKQGYRDQMVLRKVAAMQDRATNGVTLADEQASGGALRKDYKGLSANTVQSLADKDPGVASVLGPDGILDMKRMGQMLQEPKLRADASKLSSLISGHMAGHWIRGGTGALVGGGIAEARGKPLTEGIATGMAAGLGSRLVFRRLMTEPEAGRLFRFAIENRVNPKIAVPLIASTLARSERGSDGDNEGTTDQAGQEGANP